MNRNMPAGYNGPGGEGQGRVEENINGGAPAMGGVEDEDVPRFMGAGPGWNV